MVRGTIEETLNALLDAEADQFCGAGCYERNEARQDTRAGSHVLTLQTSAGEVNLKVPKLRRQTFETARHEAELGRRGTKCLTAGGQRGQFRGVSRDSGHLRRRQGGQVWLVRLSAAAGRSRPQGHAADYFRCLPRVDGLSTRGTLAALHGAFLPECL